MESTIQLADMYKQDFDALQKQYDGDIGEWASDLFLDVEYTINANGDLKRLCLQRTAGGPNAWVCLNGTDFVTVEVYEPFKEPKKITFSHPMAKEVFSYFDDLLHETIICENK